MNKDKLGIIKAPMETHKKWHTKELGENTIGNGIKSLIYETVRHGVELFGK